jgi:hypothetical protein
MERPPCELCHFCLKSIDVQERGRRGYCVWFNLRMKEEDLHDRGAYMRRMCIKDGDHFVWRMDNVGRKLRMTLVVSEG